MRNVLLAAAASFLFAGSAAFASGPIPYPSSGTQNTALYDFTASADGDVVAYYYGSDGAYFDETLGLEVNGLQQGSLALDNHSSSEGDSYDFGPVTAGQQLTFFIHVNDQNGGVYNLYSDPLQNPGATQQVYSTNYSGGTPTTGSVSIPAGTYVGFEDENPTVTGYSDFNYQDEQFVFTNVAAATVSATPEPASWALMFAGVGGIGLMLRRGRRALRSGQPLIA